MSPNATHAALSTRRTRGQRRNSISQNAIIQQQHQQRQQDSGASSRTAKRDGEDNVQDPSDGSVCESCNGRFAYKSDLKRHYVEVHQGKRPFRCDKCGKGFGRKTTLISHLTSTRGCRAEAVVVDEHDPAEGSSRLHPVSFPCQSYESMMRQPTLSSDPSLATGEPCDIDKKSVPDMQVTVAVLRQELFDVGTRVLNMQKEHQLDLEKLEAQIGARDSMIQNLQDNRKISEESLQVRVNILEERLENLRYGLETYKGEDPLRGYNESLSSFGIVQTHLENEDQPSKAVAARDNHQSVEHGEVPLTETTHMTSNWGGAAAAAASVVPYQPSDADDSGFCGSLDTGLNQYQASDNLGARFDEDKLDPRLRSKPSHSKGVYQWMGDKDSSVKKSFDGHSKSNMHRTVTGWNQWWSTISNSWASEMADRSGSGMELDDAQPTGPHCRDH